MRRWSSWDWLAYACLLVGAVVLAADTAFKLAPDLAQRLPFWVQSPLWGFAPLVLILIATIIFLANWAGILSLIFGPRHPIKFFLERDSSTDLYGIQTFPGIDYIQISVTASRRIEKCRAWITRVEYETGPDYFAVEFSERFPIPWSKSGKQNDLEYDLEPNEPPIRLNAAKYDSTSLGLDPGTPTNLFPLLQRKGTHRFTIFATGLRIDGSRVKETRYLDILWSGPGSCAFVQLKDRP